MTDSWDKAIQQKIGYTELEKFVPGEGGLTYYPVPEQEWKEWQQNQDKKAMEEYLKREEEKKKKRFWIPIQRYSKMAI